MNFYNAVEPWAPVGILRGRVGGRLRPIVGYLGSQINIAYAFRRDLVQSWVQSFAYLLDGNIGAIARPLVNGVVNAFTGLIRTRSTGFPGYLPPLPPIPPFGAAAAQASTLAAPTPAKQTADSAETVAPAVTTHQAPVKTIRTALADVTHNVADTVTQHVAATVDQVPTLRSVEVVHAAASSWPPACRASCRPRAPLANDSGSGRPEPVHRFGQARTPPGGRQWRLGTVNPTRRTRTARTRSSAAAAPTSAVRPRVRRNSSTEYAMRPGPPKTMSPARAAQGQHGDCAQPGQQRQRGRAGWNRSSTSPTTPGRR